MVKPFKELKSKLPAERQKRIEEKVEVAMADKHVKVEPLSKRGKQLVKQYGETWKVRIAENNGDVLIEPLEQINPAKPYSRWTVYGDTDMKIAYIW